MHKVWVNSSPAERPTAFEGGLCSVEVSTDN